MGVRLVGIQEPRITIEPIQDTLHIDPLTDINYSVSNSRILSLRSFMWRKCLFIGSIRLFNSLARCLSCLKDQTREERAMASRSDEAREVELGCSAERFHRKQARSNLVKGIAHIIPSGK
jgi:hypothetical protein